MKLHVLFLFLLFSVVGHTTVIVPAVEEETQVAKPANAIVSAIQTANSKLLASYFAPNITLSLPDKDDIYSKGQAEIIVRDFFMAQKVKSFAVINQGASKGGAQYTIGKLITQQGVYRTYFLVKQVDNAPQIQQLRFEKE